MSETPDWTAGRRLDSCSAAAAPSPQASTQARRPTRQTRGSPNGTHQRRGHPPQGGTPGEREGHPPKAKPPETSEGGGGGPPQGGGHPHPAPAGPCGKAPGEGPPSPTGRPPRDEEPRPTAKGTPTSAHGRQGSDWQNTTETREPPTSQNPTPGNQTHKNVSRRKRKGTPGGFSEGATDLDTRHRRARPGTATQKL